MADEHEDNPLDRPVLLFGRDVRKIPCFRDSILYGIGSGLVGGLIVFMFTSKPRLSADCMVGTFGAVTLSYWIMCRQRWAEQRWSMGQIRSAMKGEGIWQGPEEHKSPTKVEVVDV